MYVLHLITLVVRGIWLSDRSPHYARTMDDSGQQVGLSENDRGLRLTVTELTTNNPVAAVGTRIEAGAEATTRKRGATTEAQPSEAVIRKRGATIAAQPKVGFCVQACVIEIHYLENRFTADVEIYVNFMPPKNEQNEDRRERDSSRTRFVTLDISDPVLAWKPALGTFYAAHKAEIQVENYVLDSHTGRVFILVNSIVDLHETFELHDFPFDRRECTCAAPSHRYKADLRAPSLYCLACHTPFLTAPYL